ncbi:MAG TPA: hypothetical protein VLK29_00875 [Luteimonas sp.]|nr:hypothetical protein [Luteimonas sp.]
MRIRPLAAALLALAACGPAAAATAPAPYDLAMIRGGAIEADAVGAGSRLYLPTGRVISTWNYANPAAPLRVATSAPAGGVINGLVRIGDHLYASWSGISGEGGVATWSLADPDRPALLSDVTYPAKQIRATAGLVAAQGQLYLFDSENGVYVADLSNPATPAFGVPALPGFTPQYTRIVAQGDRIHATGRTFQSSSVLDVYDVGQPQAPVRIASSGVDGFNSFHLYSDGRHVMGTGLQLTTFALDGGSQLVPRAAIDIPLSMAGVRTGSRAFTFGADTGLNAWTVASAGAPRPAQTLAASTLGARRGFLHGTTLLVPTGTDLLRAYRVPKVGPVTLTSTSWLPAGIGARDFALHDGRALLLQPNSGFTLNDPQTLEPVARFEADLPEALQQRDFEQVVVQGDIAYLVGWGFGMMTVDLSGATPVELGRLPVEFAYVLDVKDRYAYVAKWTNGGLLGVVDVLDPAQPQLVWQTGLTGQPFRLKVANGHLFVAETQEADAAGTGGLRVFSIANPAAPVQVASLDDGCGSAFDVAVDAAVSLAYLACGEELQVIDIANPAQPVVIGRYDPGAKMASSYTAVAQGGERAWYSDDSGVHELDVSDPTAPVRTRLTPVGHRGVERLSTLPDGRLFALTGQAGVHVFAPAKGDSKAPLARPARARTRATAPR